MHELAVDAAENARPWVLRLARLGYASKGVVYLLVAWIAVQAALGNGGTTGSRGALAFLIDKPFGKLLLALVAVPRDETLGGPRFVADLRSR